MFVNPLEIFIFDFNTYAPKPAIRNEPMNNMYLPFSMPNLKMNG